MQFTLNINGKSETVDVEPETPLLWVLRDNIGLTGTKYGCGIARCGACTIHVDGQPTKACQLPASAAVGKQITTIEGLSSEQLASGPASLGGDRRSAMRLLPERSDHVGRRLARQAQESDRLTEIEAAMADNLCRCGTYQRIVQAIRRASELAQA